MTIGPGIAIVRRNTEEVQGRGNFDVFEELFAIDFVDHTPQPVGVLGNVAFSPANAEQVSTLATGVGKEFPTLQLKSPNQKGYS